MKQSYRTARWFALAWPHGVVSVLVGGAVCVGVLGWWLPAFEVLEALEAEVAQLQSSLERRTPLVSSLATDSAPAVPAVADWPTIQETTRVWPWLQQGLQANGLQVQSMEPLPVSTAHPLPEQPVQCRLQGRWRDWLAWLQAMEEHAPWWVFDHWSVQPAGTPGAVRIEFQARLGLQATRPPVARAWTTWPAPSSHAVGAQVFDPPAGLVGPGQEPPTPQAPSRQWRVSELRLLGIWQQAGGRHAVLGAGSDWLVVSPGQQVGHEHYRVQAVSASGLDLVPVSGNGPPLHLGWQGEPR